jgi:hypothetical protein
MLALPASLLPESLGPYLAMMVIGFLLGTYGHMAKARWLVAVGVILIFLATFLFPLAINLTDTSPPPPGPGIYEPGANP